MKSLFCIVFTGLFYFLNGQVPGFEWAKQYGGQGAKATGGKLATDGQGSLFVLGTFTGTVDFDAGPGSYTLSQGTAPCFISKVDSSGNFVWTKTLTITGTGLVTDKDDNVLILGSFKGSVDADPGPSVFAVGSATNSTSTLILKLDGAGNFLWAKAFYGIYDSYKGINMGCAGSSISLDPTQNMYVAGTFSNKVDFDPGIGTNYQTSPHYVDNQAAVHGIYLPNFFLCKLDSTGDLIFVKTGQAYVFSQAYCIVNSQGESMSIYEKAGAYGGIQGTLFEKRAANGDLLWQKNIALNVMTAAVDRYGNYWVSGQFRGTVDFDPGPATHLYSTPTFSDIGTYVLRLDNAGDFGWAVHLDNVGSAVVPCKLLTDQGGSCYLGGTFNGAINFEPDGSNVLNSGDGNGFILKLNSYPSYMSLDWVKQFGKNGLSDIRDLNLDKFGNIYSTGSFSGTANLSPDPIPYELTAIGSVDAFVNKLSGPLATAIKTHEANNNMYLFPNPAISQLHLNTPKPLEHGKCLIYDLDGKPVLENRNLRGNAFIVEISGLQRGFYIVEISDAGYRARTKILKD